jgi:secreted Zn-dependent insulinase-like peptidase
MTHDSSQNNQQPTTNEIINTPIHNQQAYATPRQEVLTELFVRLVKDSLNETTYQVRQSVTQSQQSLGYWVIGGR